MGPTPTTRRAPAKPLATATSCLLDSFNLLCSSSCEGQTPMRAYQSFDWFEIKLLEIGGKRTFEENVDLFCDLFRTLRHYWIKRCSRGCFILSQRVILLKNLLLDLSTQEETLPNAYNVPQSSWSPFSPLSLSFPSPWFSPTTAGSHSSRYETKTLIKETIIPWLHRPPLTLFTRSLLTHPWLNFVPSHYKVDCEAHSLPHISPSHLRWSHAGLWNASRVI